MIHLGQLGALYHMGRSKLFDQLAMLQAEIEELRTKHAEAVEGLRGCLQKGGCPVICGKVQNRQGITAATPEDSPLAPAGDEEEQLGCRAGQG